MNNSQLFEMNEEVLIVFEPSDENPISSIVFTAPTPEVTKITFQESTDDATE